MSPSTTSSSEKGVSRDHSFPSKLLAVLEITRSPQSLITAILVGLLAFFYRDGDVSPARITLASLAYLQLSCAGFAINDYFDIEIDRVNKPDRPLPAGVIQPNTALALMALLFAGSVASAWAVGPMFFAITVPNAVLLAAYSAYFKRHGGVIANALMGIYAACVVVSGVSVSGHVSVSTAIAAAALFAYMLGTQIVMCIEDIQGDAALGANTLPIRRGVRWSLGLATPAMLGGLATYAATIRGLTDGLMVAVAISVNLYVFVKLLRAPTSGTARKLRVFMALTLILMVVIVVLRGRP